MRSVEDGPDGLLGEGGVKLAVDSVGGGVLGENLGDTLGEVELDVVSVDFLAFFKGLADHGDPACCGEDVV